MPNPVPSTFPMSHRQAAPARASANARLLRLLPIVLVFYSFLLFPPEVSIAVAGLNLPSYRLALLVMALPAFAMMVRGRKGVGSPIDAAVVLLSFWLVLSFSVIYGFEIGLVRGSGLMIDTALPYLVARACVRSPKDLRYFLLLCLPGFLFAGSALALESLSGRLLLRPAFASVFGSETAYTAGEATGSLVLVEEKRLGLLRAYGPFSHPILAGVVMAGLLPLYYFSGLRSWPFFLGLGATLAGFFSLSSATFLGFFILLAAIIIYHVKPSFPRLSWWTISGMIALLLWVMHMGSQNGIIAVLSRLTLTPHTAGYRMLIWEYGSLSVAKNPWFGIGYQSWERLDWMGESVDAHFLLLAMRHGLIVPIILLAAVAYGVIRLGLVSGYLAPQERNFAIGFNISMLIFIIVGQTVAFFGSANLVFMSMVAFLASILVWADQDLRSRSRPVVRHLHARRIP